MNQTSTEISEKEKTFFIYVPFLRKKMPLNEVVSFFNEHLYRDPISEEEFCERYRLFADSLLKEEEKSDPAVIEFLESHKEQKCPSVEKLLNEYETWRKGHVENESENKEKEKPTAYFPFFNSFIPIEKENKCSDPIKDMTFKFLNI